MIVPIQNSTGVLVEAIRLDDPSTERLLVVALQHGVS